MMPPSLRIRWLLGAMAFLLPLLVALIIGGAPPPTP